MKRTTRMAFAALSATTIATSLGGGLAQADPNGTPTYRALAGMGSDTTEEVIQALSDVVQIGGVKQIGSYNATGTATVVTKDPAVNAACSLTRANGSSAGRDALLATLQPGAATAGCLDFARSSSSRGTFTSSPSLTYVPFAVEGLSFAITNTSTIPRKLTKAQLVSIYQCTLTGGGTYKPMLPQAGSGSRSTWLKYIYGSDTVNLAPFTCLVDNGAQEHDGRVLDDFSLIPYSSSQWISQASGTISDKRGRSTLGQIDGTLAITSNASFANKRDLFNIIPTAKINEAPWSTVFVGGSSLVCTSSATLLQYGMSPHATCGSTTSQS